jgi:hypothetical protein
MSAASCRTGARFHGAAAVFGLACTLAALSPAQLAAAQAPSDIGSPQAPPTVSAGPVPTPPPAQPPAAPVPVAAPEVTFAPAPPPPTAAPVEAPTPPVVIASASSEPYAEPPQSAARGTRCLLAGLCFGPVLTAGVLDVFGIGAQVRGAYWGVGIDYQFVHFTTQGVGVRLSLLTVEGRVYPFGGAFFLGAGLAWQAAKLASHITYSGDARIPPIEADLTGRINVPVFKLGIGFMGRSGFVMGVDLALGVQLGGNTVEFGSSLPRIDQVIAAENKIRNRADKFVRDLPLLVQMNLLRFGYLF